MNSSKSALIIGCGYVGNHLRSLLEIKGWDVWTARRTKDPAKKSLSIDVRNDFTLPRDFDVIFYMVSAGAYTHEAYQNAYVRGVHHTLSAIRNSSNSPLFIFVSSTSVFSENNGALVDENSETDSTSFSKASLLQGEASLSASGLKYSIVRLSGIYGPGRTRMIQAILSREARLKRNSFISNRIHVEDCAGILHHLATIKNPEPLYIGTDCEPTPYNEVLKWLGNKLDIGEIEMEAETETSESIHMSNKRCSNAKILSAGYKFLYPNFRKGFLSCL
jgi:nucleoside-diphosphate-sugar epimerase